MAFPPSHHLIPRLIAPALPLACIVLLPVAAACGSSDQAPAPAPSPASAPAPEPAPAGPWNLAWSDEFDGPSGSKPDGAKWVHDTGGGGWGNNELQTYTDRRENAALRDGVLVITAVREPFTGTDGVRRDYTSARLKTLGTFSQAYGKFESRIRIPRGQGIWPAFWMLGEDIATAGWPACGEIDIMENIGREPNLVHGTIHGPGHSGAQAIGGATGAPGGGAFSEDFHVFTLEWEPRVIRWYVDGALYQTRTPADLPAGARWVYDKPMFLLLNLAVGGNWPGNPDPTTEFPQQLQVDWVRVYKRAGAAPPPASDAHQAATSGTGTQGPRSEALPE
jgi:beta-glucanase (GH16 family)